MERTQRKLTDLSNKTLHQRDMHKAAKADVHEILDLVKV